MGIQRPPTGTGCTQSDLECICLQGQHRKTKRCSSRNGRRSTDWICIRNWQNRRIFGRFQVRRGRPCKAEKKLRGHPAVIRSWRKPSEQFVPGFGWPTEGEIVCRCSTKTVFSAADAQR